MAQSKSRDQNLDISLSIDLFNNLGIKYEEAFSSDSSLSDFVNASLDRLQPGSSVLELGSGTGKPTAELVVRRGHKLHGIDFSPVMIELARRQVPGATFEEADILDYAPSVQYDAVFTIFSLFPLLRERMTNLTQRWRTWVKPGGYVFIGTMVADDFSDVQPHMLDADGHAAHGVEHTFMGKRNENLLFTRLGWKSLLEDGGFEIVSTNMAMYQAPPEACCDVEPHYYIAGRRKI